MKFQNLLIPLAAESNDPWFVVTYPGPIVCAASSGIAGIIRKQYPHVPDRKAYATLLELFECVPRIIPANELLKLSTPLGGFDSLRVIPVSSRGEPEMLLVFLRQSAEESPTMQLRRVASELTDRQFEVLEGVYAGETNRSIAKRLSVSEKTVEKHRAKVMQRLGVTSIIELVRLVTLLKVQDSVELVPQLIAQVTNMTNVSSGEMYADSE